LFPKLLKSEHIHFTSDFAKSQITHWSQNILQVKLHPNIMSSEMLNNTNGEPLLSWEANYCKPHFSRAQMVALKHTNKIKSNDVSLMSHQHKLWIYRFMSASQNFLLVW